MSPSNTSVTAMAERRLRRLRWALALNLTIVAVQVGFGLFAHSLGLLADAGHNLTDVAAIVLSLVAIRMSTRPPTAARSFGYHRSSVLAAQANAAGVLAITAVIAFEAVRRLIHPEAVRGGIVLVVALVAVAANLAGALALREDGHQHGDLAVRSVMLHLGGDALASLGVAVAGGIMLTTGGARWLDPVASLAIGALITVEAIKLLRSATDVLLESTPEGLDMAEVAHVMAGVTGVEDVHDLHAWSLSSEVRALSAHVVMAGHPTLEEAQAVADRVKQAVAVPFAISHATLELECESCVEDGGDPCAMDSATTHP
jgi:cobalt-zinc-cadmium efflux system protein